MTSWKIRIEARMLSWASVTPFGVPVVPGRVDELEDVLGGGWLPGGLERFPVGREERIVVGGFRAQRLDDGGREVLEPGLARVRGVAAGAEDQVPGL